MFPRGSIYTTIRELGPQIAYYRRKYGSQFSNGCICGPSGFFIFSDRSGGVNFIFGDRSGGLNFGHVHGRCWGNTWVCCLSA